MTSQALDEVFAEIFEKLCIKIRDKNLDYQKIENIEKLDEFDHSKRFWKKNLGNSISSDELHGLIIEQFRESKIFHGDIFSKIFNRFSTFLDEEKKYMHYFCPIYNFESNIGEMKFQRSTDSKEIDQIKIRKIKPWEKEFLHKTYEHWMPAEVQIEGIEYCLIVSISKRLQEVSLGADEIMQEVLDKFRLCKNGAIKFGGCYQFKEGSEWNPHRSCILITHEKAGMHDRDTYKLDKNDEVRFLSLLKKIDSRYPIDDKKYSTYFEKIIRRFSSTVDKKSTSEKLTDLVICMESLLVGNSYGGSQKFKQNSAMLLGNNFEERIKIASLMESFYNYRSGQVHVLEERKILLNEKNIPIEEGLEIMRDYTKRAILKIIVLSQEPEFEELEYMELIKKIENSIYDSTLQEKFQAIENKISV